jgi:hypothetical protein
MIELGQNKKIQKINKKMSPQKNDLKKCQYCIISITMEMINDESEIIINNFFK